MKPLPPFRFSHSQQTKNRVWDGRVENTEFDKRCRIPGGGKNQISGGAPILNFSVLAVGRPFEVGRVPRPVIFMKRKKFGKSLFCLHHILPCLLFGTHVCRHYVRNPFVAASIRDPTPHSPRRKEGGGGTNTFPTVTF